MPASPAAPLVAAAPLPGAMPSEDWMLASASRASSRSLVIRASTRIDASSL